MKTAISLHIMQRKEPGLVVAGVASYANQSESTREILQKRCYNRSERPTIIPVTISLSYEKHRLVSHNLEKRTIKERWSEMQSFARAMIQSVSTGNL